MDAYIRSTKQPVLASVVLVIAALVVSIFNTWLIGALYKILIGEGPYCRPSDKTPVCSGNVCEYGKSADFVCDHTVLVVWGAMFVVSFLVLRWVTKKKS